MYKRKEGYSKVYLTKQQVQEMNERHGWFEFSDAQSDVSNDFANEAIERYERIRAAAPTMYAALENVKRNLEIQGLDVPGLVGNIGYNEVCAALAKAKGE